MNFRERKEFKVFRELLHSVPGLEAHLMDSSEEEITALADFVCSSFCFVCLWLNLCHADPERCMWGKGR